MDSLVEKLEVFGLKEFVNEYRHELCQRTVNQSKVAALLHFDFDQSAVINHPPDNFSKCEKLYEVIQKKSKVKDFIEALQETGNDHIIEFIESADLSACGQSSSASANLTMGIWFNIPEPIDSFYGREDFLSQLHDKLKPQDDSETEVTGLSQVKIMSGLGGIGKTETARKYIMKHRKFYNNFIWIHAETKSSMADSFLKLAKELEISTTDSEGQPREIDEIVKEIYNKICEGGKSNLIIFDNAEDYQSCKNFFPFGLHPDLKRPVILATSRNQEWTSHTGKKIQFLPLDVLTDDESLEFILKELEIPESDIPEFKEESKEFIQLLGGLPLALQQAVAYIRQEKELRELAGTSYKISDYVQEFKLSMEKFLSFSPVPESTPDSSPTVFVSWNVTFYKIQKLPNGEEAVKILEILSFLYADKIPSSFLHSLIPQVELRNFILALKLLKKYSLVKYNAKDFSMSIHRQLQFVILQYLENRDEITKTLIDLSTNCLAVLEKIKISNESESSNIFLNIRQMFDQPFQFSATPRLIVFICKFALVLNEAGRFIESLDTCFLMHQMSKTLLGEDCPLTLGALGMVASQLCELGKYSRSLELSIGILGKVKIHPDLKIHDGIKITTMHNIATSLWRLKKYEASLNMFQQLLTLEFKVFGKNHPSTFGTQFMIARLYGELGDSSKSSALLQQLETMQMSLPNSETMLSLKVHKAIDLLDKEEFHKASKLFKEVHAQHKETLGEYHPNTLTDLVCLTQAVKAETNNFPEALSQFKKVYEIKKKYLSVDHPELIDVKLKIATTLMEMKEYDESLKMLQDMYNQLPKIPGENHNREIILALQFDIAKKYAEEEQMAKAMKLFEDVERMQIDVLGPWNPQTVATGILKLVYSTYCGGRMEP